MGAKNLLEVVNKDSRWNGKLSDAMSLLGNTVDSVRNEFLTWQYVTEEYKEGNTNLAYMIVDLDNKKFIPTVLHIRDLMNGKRIWKV